MKLKTLKWAQAILLSLLILLPKQILAYQKTVVLPPTRNYTIHGRIVDSFTNLPIAKVKLTLLSADSTVIDTCRTFIWNDKAVHPDSYFYMQENLSEGKYIFKIEHPDYLTTFVNKEILFKRAVSTCKCTARKVKEYFRKNTQKGYENLIFLSGDGLFFQQLC